MATYGPWAPASGLAPGQIPFTGWSPTLGNGPANAGSSSGFAQFNGYNQRDFYDIKGLRTAGGRALRRLLVTLVGNSPGPTAQEFRYQVQAPISTVPPGFSGQRPIVAVPYVNRATVTNDDTQLTAFLNRAVTPASYPADLSGNGGGGKLHYLGIG